MVLAGRQQLGARDRREDLVLMTQLNDIEQKLRQARDKERFGALREAEEVAGKDVFG